MTNENQQPDHNGNDQISTDKPNSTSKPRMSGNFILFLILVLLTASGGGQYFLYQKYLGLHKATLISNDISDNFKQLIELNTADSKILTSNIGVLGKNVKTNQENITLLLSALKEVNNINQNPNLYIKLLSVENLLNSADFKLKIDKDIPNAKDLLKNAEQYIKGSKQVNLITLRKNIIKKLQQLEEINILDEIKLFANLEEVSARFDKLTALDLMVNVKSNDQNKKTPQQNSLDDANTQETSDNIWQSALSNFKNDLLDLVRIRQFDPSENNITQLLTDDQVSSLKLLLNLNVEQATVDLKQKNYVRFNQDIDKLLKNIDIYFKNNETLRNKLLNLIKPLKDINYPDNVPDLNDLLSGIRAAMADNA